MPCFENLRVDIQFRLSEKPELINNTLPARASQLAQRLANILEPLFSINDGTVRQASRSSPQRNDSICLKWMPNLEAVFLDALKLVVKLRQRETPTEFFWPKTGVAYDENCMQTENNGEKVDYEGKMVLLTLLPAALSHVATDGEQGGTEDEIYYKAAVFLDMKSS
jgi:hypothetical protein